MNYLNIHTDFLRSEAYLGAEPIERATWLNLMAWCASQENGGVIENAESWTDRKWQQLCGITLDEVKTISSLYGFKDGSLMVSSSAEILEDSLKFDNKMKLRAIQPLAKLRRAERLKHAKSLGTHTKSEWEEVLSLSGNKCLCCGSTEKIQKDHVIAVSRGGSDSITNLQPLCAPCNIRKGARTIDYRKDVA